MRNPERKGTLGIPRNRWGVNIHIGVKGMGYEDMGWFIVVQGRGNMVAAVKDVMRFAVA